jgi:hypothetical protein
MPHRWGIVAFMEAYNYMPHHCGVVAFMEAYNYMPLRWGIVAYTYWHITIRLTVGGIVAFLKHIIICIYNAGVLNDFLGWRLFIKFPYNSILGQQNNQGFQFKFIFKWLFQFAYLYFKTILGSRSLIALGKAQLLNSL